MNNFFRTIIAGYGAKKLGGGCLSTIIVFIVIYYALGTCNSHPAQVRHAAIQPIHHTSPVASSYSGKSKVISVFPLVTASGFK
ncbi:MAG: hypothetical protein ABJA57_10950 [Ginsengibacter sp.]